MSGAALVSEAGTQHVAPTEALLFVLVAILIGVATQFFLTSRWLRLPYTAVLLVFGLCIGLLQGISPPPATHAFTATLSMWMSIDPHLLLLIFLPTIGFSAALSQEPHLLRRNWGQILILAWPGVVVTFLLIALAAKFFFPYGWSWPEALLFGAMLSATDPVAVVAVLHAVGADAKLSSVIDGESLVNDGSALVIFLVLQRFVQGASLTPGEIVVLFLQLALLGAAIGAAFGLATSLWLAAIFNEPGLEIILTFGAAYACYFVAEELAGASGLLAVVVMGFSMSLLGGRQITNRIKTEMHAFWEALEWMANTILFLWVGIALGFVLLEPSDPLLKNEQVRFSSHLAASDAGYAVVLYLWLIVARTVSIATFFPLLSTGKIGYAMTWRTAAVMVWAGLRGAVGVAMSLFILFDPLIESHEYKVHCVFFMALMAFATVLINGSTTKQLLQRLGLLKMTPQQVQVLEHVLKEVDGIRDSRLQQAQPNPILGAPDRQTVQRWTSVNAVATLNAARRRLLHSDAMHTPGRARGGSTRAAVDAAVDGRLWAQLQDEYRGRLLRVVKASYGDMFQAYELNSAEVGTLQEVTDKALDVTTRSSAPKPASSRDPEAGADPASTLTDWAELRAVLRKPGLAGRLQALLAPCSGASGRAALLDKPRQQQLAQRLQLVTAFVAAHMSAQELLRIHLANTTQPPTPGADANDDAAAPAAASKAAAAAPATLDPTVQPGGGAAPAPAGASAVARNELHLGGGGGGGGGGGSSAGSSAGSGSGSGEGGEGEAAAARLVLRESEAQVEAAIEYAHKVLLPHHPQLATRLVSRQAAIGILEEQLDFLESIEAAGLIRSEEVHSVQARVSHRLEMLQHARSWHLPPTAAKPEPGAPAASPAAGAHKPGAAPHKPPRGAALPAPADTRGDPGGDAAVRNAAAASLHERRGELAAAVQRERRGGGSVLEQGLSFQGADVNWLRLKRTRSIPPRA